MITIDTRKNIIWGFTLLLMFVRPAYAADCNSNSIDDTIDVSLRGYQIGSTVSVPFKSVTAGISAVTLRLTPIDIADFDGDNAPDLWGRVTYFSGNSVAALIFVYFNRGDNTFEDPVVITYDDSASFFSTIIGNLQVSDVNGDGKPDFVFTKKRSRAQGVPTETFDVEVLRNNGARGFVAESTNIGGLLPVPTMSDLTFLAAKDIAPNTVNDLVLVYQGNYYAFYQIGSFQFLPFSMGPVSGATGIVVRAQGPGGPMDAFNSQGIVARAQANSDGTIVRGENFYNPGGRLMSFVSEGADVYESGIFGIRAERPTFGTEPGSTALAFRGFSGYPYELPLARSSIGGVRKIISTLDFNLDGRNDIALLGPNLVQVLFHDEDSLLYIEDEVFRTRVTLRPATADDVPISAADFNNDSKPDVFYRNADATAGVIALNNSTLPFLAAEAADLDANSVPDSCDRAVPLDFDGDRVSDVTVIRGTAPLSWFAQPRSLVASFQNNLSFLFGLPGDTAMAGDFDGNGTVRPGVVRNELGGLSWYWLDPSNATQRLQFGLAGDMPVTGYFDTDRALDRAVVRQIGGNLHWFVRRSSDPSSFVEFNWGLPGDVAFAADFDNDKVDEAVVARRIAGGVYWFVRDLNGTYSFSTLWGLSGDTIFPPADTDGDGLAAFVVARADGVHVQAYSSEGFGETNVLTVGKSGDNVFTLSHSGLSGIEFGSRNNYTGFAVPVIERVSQSGSRYPLSLGFGFHTDAIVGADGRVAPTVGFRGALRCQTVLPTSTGMGGFAWVGTQPGKPNLFIPPILVRQTSAVKIFSSKGVQLDTMTLTSRGAGRYTARRLTREQLQSLLGPLNVSGTSPDALVAQVELKNGSVLCQVVPFAAAAN